MNVQKLTQKSMEAIQSAQKICSDHRNTQVDQMHLLLALLTQEDGLIGSMLQGMQKDTKALAADLENGIGGLARSSTPLSSDQVYVTGELNNALNEAENIAKKMGDSYTSCEHLMLGLIKLPSSAVRALFRKYGITEEAFLAQLKQVRGNRHVDSDDPESIANWISTQHRAITYSGDFVFFTYKDVKYLIEYIG